MAEQDKTKKKKKEQAEQPQDEGIRMTPEEFEQARANIEKLQAERDEYLATAQRLQAEFDNFRKRNASARAESFEDGAREVIRELLPVVDNFGRAVDSLDEEAKKTGFPQGVLMVQKQMLDALARVGLEEIGTDGPFDPELHEAVMMVEQEGVEPGGIACVTQKGYKFKGRPLRCSMVQIAK